MKKSAKPGLAEKYQLAIVGDYPTTVRPFQTVKLTLDVVSEGPSTLMINVLAKSDFSWAGGKIVPGELKGKGREGISLTPECMLQS